MEHGRDMRSPPSPSLTSGAYQRLVPRALRLGRPWPRPGPSVCLFDLDMSSSKASLAICGSTNPRSPALLVGDGLPWRWDGRRPPLASVRGSFLSFPARAVISCRAGLVNVGMLVREHGKGAERGSRWRSNRPSPPFATGHDVSRATIHPRRAPIAMRPRDHAAAVGVPAFACDGGPIEAPRWSRRARASPRRPHASGPRPPLVHAPLAVGLINCFGA